MDKRCLLVLCLGAVLNGCGDAAPRKTDLGQREVVQGFHATFVRQDGAAGPAYELVISVDASATFVMPVRFVSQGRAVAVDEKDAKHLFDRWLKKRASLVAATGSLDPSSGIGGPFLAIDTDTR